MKESKFGEGEPPTPTYTPVNSQGHDHRPCALSASQVGDGRRERGLRNNGHKCARHNAWRRTLMLIKQEQVCPIYCSFTV